MSRIILYFGGTFVIGNILYCGFHQYHVHLVNDHLKKLNNIPNKSKLDLESMKNIQQWKKLSVFEQTTSLPEILYTDKKD